MVRRRRARAVLAGAVLLGVLRAAVGQAALPVGVWLPDPGPDPTARSGAAAGYDPVHQQTLLFGGFDLHGRALRDTWVFDVTGWHRVGAPGPPPAARGAASMAWDGLHLVLFGGQATSGGTRWFADTWLWNGQGWQPVRTQTAPAARSYAAAAGDATGIVLYGGWAPLPRAADGAGDLGDTWSFDGRTLLWRRMTTTAGPGARRQAQLVFDRTRHALLMFGGTGGQVQDNDTWLLRRGRWQLVDLCRSGPCPAGGPAQLVDDGQEPLLLTQALSGQTTWTWTGNRWTQLVGDDPAGRLGGVAAVDSTRHLLVVTTGTSFTSPSAAPTDLLVLTPTR